MYITPFYVLAGVVILGIRIRLNASNSAPWMFEAKEMAEARHEVAGLLEAGRKKIADEGASLEAALRIAEKDLARDIAGRVLGREVS